MTYSDIEIPDINSKDPLVPVTSLEITLPEKYKKAIAIALRDNLPCLLVGETGTGKTSIVKHMAFLRKQPYVRVNMTGFTTPDELIGSKSIKGNDTYFEYGIITDAMRRGAMLVLDEINATTPDCLFILHGLLDEDRRITLPNGDVITPHDDFRVFATCNPDYEGTRSMNKAFLDRFPIILDIKPLGPKEESELLIKRTGILKTDALLLVKIANLARDEYFKNKLTAFVSTRTLLNTSKLMMDGMSIREAYELTIMRKSNNVDEQKVILDFLLATTKTHEAHNSGQYEIIHSSEIDEMKKKAKQFDESIQNTQIKETIVGTIPPIGGGTRYTAVGTALGTIQGLYQSLTMPPQAVQAGFGLSQQAAALSLSPVPVAKKTLKPKKSLKKK